MREFVKIREKAEILNVLQGFSDVFPHLCEKIDSLDAYAEKLSQFAEFCIGTEDGVPFGLAVFYANDMQSKTAYISLIGVKSSHRSQGLGYWLLTNCENAARARSMTQLRLEVDLDNPTAIAFYERNGFSLCGHTQRGSMYMSKYI